MYDSAPDTLEHIEKVKMYLTYCASDLLKRGLVHDASKLEEPEKSAFDGAVSMKNLVFGSPEYLVQIEQIRPALVHHYANNRHHPQYYENGITDMTLFDLIEMFFDWRASTERGKDGDILKSIEINQTRFGISKQLKNILINTEHYVREQLK